MLGRQIGRPNDKQELWPPFCQPSGTDAILDRNRRMWSIQKRGEDSIKWVPALDKRRYQGMERLL